MDVTLVMFTPQGERRDFSIRGEKTVVGRTSECGLQIPLSDISRKHCEIYIKSGHLSVRDLGSSNGTYINNRRIQHFDLKAGDTLTIGPVIFTVVIDGEPASIKKVLTILDAKKTKNKGSQPSGGPDDTGSVDLDESGPLEIVTHAEDNDASNNPLAELEALSKQKKI